MPEQVRWSDMVAVRLGFGADKAVTIGRLAEDMGIPRRMVEQAVTDLRLQGRPVASDGRGVWLSDSAKEMADQAQRLRERALHQLLTARAVRATARRMAASEARVQQMGIWEAA